MLREYFNCFNEDEIIIYNCRKAYQMHHQDDVLDHVIRVSKIAERLASEHKYDIVSVVEVSYLHDISLCISTSEYIGICKYYNIHINDLERQLPALLHQKVSMLIVREVFGIHSKTSLDAIACHTTLRAHATTLDMILFLADKLSWGEQQAPFQSGLKKMLESSLVEACLYYIDYSLENGLIQYAHPSLLEAQTYLRAQIEGERL